MSIKVAVVGTGAFAQSFIRLFKAHPDVSEVVLSDLDAEKLARNAKEHGITRTLPSLDAVCESDVDAVAIITQHWLHAPQAVQALRAGKHVYSAVPSAIAIDEMTELVKAVEETGQIYMLGETSYYYPETVYCRQRHERGDFGHVVYGDGEYYHDWDHGMYDVAKWRCGENWRQESDFPPMYYPTHSMSMIVSVTNAYATAVSCQGFVDRKPEDADIYDGSGKWQNRFSNETALFKMSDGSSCRINEFRRVGHPGTVRMTLFGTEGAFEHNCAGHIWVNKENKNENLDALLKPAPMHTGRGLMSKVTSADGTHAGFAAIHDVPRLPEPLLPFGGGHSGSHPFLVDDFVRGCISKTHPPNNVWQAARYLMPGLIAHDSAVAGGKLLEIPDFGDGPK